MARIVGQERVLRILENLRGIDGLKRLFWEELNYDREDRPLSVRQWHEHTTQHLAEDPVLFASGGEDGAFHVVYCRLDGDTPLRAPQRLIAAHAMRDHPYCLLVFSERSQSSWHFVNMKYDERVERRRLLRRIAVEPNAALRTAAERLQLLDLATMSGGLGRLSPLAIQERCDEAFDVERVTKEFYREIANWYFWALRHARLPKGAPKEADGRDHISIIRLITRLIFCWFVKEKGLIPPALFDERELMRLLVGFAPEDDADDRSVFYRAILQNLFFATLNTEMENREWATGRFNFMAHTVYRYRECFKDPDTALDVFRCIPFLNGGLFECLDRDLGEGAHPRCLRVDGFSRRSDSQATVPDFLFFGAEREEDLSPDYGQAKFSRAKVRGLIHTFNRYRFTITESTPIEQEVALDPELSGKVFENLLAAYNPETGTTARKQTGSFYTPREVVEYMVDESLIAYLKTRLEAADATAPEIEVRLRHLFEYSDEPHRFTPAETDALIAAIDQMKALDPAVGSGAFPMGILHRLVFILGKLDPRNEKWKERQIQRVRDAIAAAERIEEADVREHAMRELEQQISGVSEAFERNELDYGRKLFLIENCIYGVDIQPIAVQIAKMRFFISLIVDQRVDPSAPNLGIRALPNLETKFVAANTLIGLTRPGQQLLRNVQIEAKEAELRRVRERHFSAATMGIKSRCREKDARLRAEIADLLKEDGWDDITARQLASWDPYDQNASALFFDPEWMFGVTDGFDIAIGNPPYRLISELEFLKSYRIAYPLISGKPDLYRMFVECGLKLTRPSGLLCLIVPNTLLAIPSARNLRQFVTENTTIRMIVDLASPVFGIVAVNNIILSIDARRNQDNRVRVATARGEQGLSDLKQLAEIPQRSWTDNPKCEWTIHSHGAAGEVASRLEAVSLPLGSVLEKLTLGMQVYHNSIHTSAQIDAKYLHSMSKLGRWWLREYSGRHISGCRVLTESPVPFVDYSSTEIYNRPELEYFQGQRLILREIMGQRLVIGFADAEFAVNKSCYVLRSDNATEDELKALLGIIQSRCVALWVQLRGDKAKQTLFPRITMNTLRRIPIPQRWRDGCADLCMAVNQIISSCGGGDGEVDRLERKVDKIVCRLYDLSDAEIRIVEEGDR